MLLQHGKGKFEFAIVVAVLGILASLLLARLQAIEEETERTEVELTVRNMRVGIQLAIGERIIRGEEGRIDEVAQANPFDYLGQRPRGLADGRVATEAGQWAYDPIRRELSYRPRLPGAFGNAETLRWNYVASRDENGKSFGVNLVRRN
jgi:type II secretory pathway pseudopilin PulG